MKGIMQRVPTARPARSRQSGRPVAARRPRGGLRRAGLLALPLLASVWWPGTADAQPVWVRWAHPEPKTVASFTIHVGRHPGAYDYTVDVGKPKKDADGVFQWLLDLSSDSGTFIAISAMGKNGLRSALSNEGFFLLPTSAVLGQPAAPTVELP